MIEVKAKIRKWGRSFGVVIPMDMIIKEKLKENETVKLLIAKPTSVLRDTFGTLKIEGSTQDILDESDRELYDE